jgi:hypothetical protein
MRRREFIAELGSSMAGGGASGRVVPRHRWASGAKNSLNAYSARNCLTAEYL